MARKQIEGLKEYGYTEQTFALARALRRSPESMTKLAAMLAERAKPIVYSNQDFDQDQSLAGFLADVMRTELI